MVADNAPSCPRLTAHSEAEGTAAPFHHDRVGYKLEQPRDIAWSDSKRNEIRFTGHCFNPSTGTYHARHREYHPSLGRFVQRDPLGYVDGPSLYQYARAKPTLGTDPSGLIVIFVHGIKNASSRQTEFIRHGIQGYLRANDLPLQAVVHFEYGPFNAVAGNMGTHYQHNEAVARALHDLVRQLQDLRDTLSSEESPCTEPIQIVAYSHGTSIVYEALSQGMSVDRVLLLGSNINNKQTWTNEQLTNAGDLVNFYSPRDRHAGLVNGVGRTGISQLDRLPEDAVRAGQGEFSHRHGIHPDLFGPHRAAHNVRIEDVKHADEDLRGLERIEGLTEWRSAHLAHEEYGPRLGCESDCLSRRRPLAEAPILTDGMGGLVRIRTDRNMRYHSGIDSSGEQIE